MKKGFLRFLAAASLFTAMPSQAENLLEIYHQALASDPIFKTTESFYYSQRELVSIARSQLLPSLSLSASTTRSIHDNFIPGARHFYETNLNYVASLNQPIFNYAAWSGLQSTKAYVKSTAATYFAAAQDLMMRVVTAYFDVLSARATLRFTRAEQRAVKEQLSQVKQQFKVGIVPITGVDEAQAKYDDTVAAEVKARNALANSIEDLRAITGKSYHVLYDLAKPVPLNMPIPSSIDQWVDILQTQNYQLQSSRYLMLAAKQDIKTARGSHLPSLNASASYNFSDTDAGGSSSSAFVSKSSIFGGTLSVNFPVYEGGALIAQTKQARYKYQEAISAYQGTYREVVAKTRKAYLGVESSIGMVNADRQTVISRQSALRSIKLAYQAGTRTIFDVLTAQSNLYKAQEQLAKDQYAYILDVLSLKQAAGTLGVTDLMAMNSWLKQRQIVFAGEHAATPVMKVKVSKKTMPTTVTPVVIAQAPDAKQIDQLPSHHYTIQLMAASDKSHVEQWVNRYQLQAETAVLPESVHQKSLYVLLYGDYETLKAAQAALETLPKGLVIYKPWIRQFASISVKN